ncbi:MAG: hypothetical protein E7117_09595 [Bacteroidales bacterium]|nr:hypothetical protein [Bacteroidales bacterium]
MRNLNILIYLILTFVSVLPVFAQKNEETDSLVVLMSAKSAQMVDVEGASFRKVEGPARFLHNNTYLLCDTALWNMETRIIEAWGNVSIIQDQTVLTSEKLTYLVDQDLAQFRGSMVQLTDKDHNTLRTRHLDYNTKDSVAVFMNGGSMRDKDGQIIESRTGTYDSKIKTFTFNNDVNMFTDSIFVKTRSLKYESDKDFATFGFRTDAWHENNMLSSNSGWYDRNKELFFFTKDVHVMSEDQEGWCDSLFFHRMTSDVEMLGNAQVNDTTRNVFGLAGRIQYHDTLSMVTLTREPAVITQSEEEDGSIDTVYLGADRLVYYTMRMCDIDSMAVVDSKTRLKSLEIDPVGTFRKKAAEEAAKVAEEERKKNDPNYAAKLNAEQQKSAGAAPAPKNTSHVSANTKNGTERKDERKGKKRSRRGDDAVIPEMVQQVDSLVVTDSLIMKGPYVQTDSLAVTDSLQRADARMSTDSLAVGDILAPADSLFMTDSLMFRDSLMVSDSLAVTDSLAVRDSLVVMPPKDTTKIGFLEALKNVRIFKKNMQVVCDSLVYSDLDSLARLFKEPLIWQDVVRQYSADSISVVISNGAMDKASMMSNAFIIIQEDTSHFDQIKGAEMMAYFDDKGGLKRFDVLGGASALFFIEENDALATVNKTDSKMLSATFKDGEIQRIYYFEQAKNDGYPVVQLSREDQRLKGFNWQPERRPEDRNAVTPLSLRPSQRSMYSARPKARFTQTEIYFPGYMNDIYRQIEVRDSLAEVRRRDAALAEHRAAMQAETDSLARRDSLMLADSLFRADSMLVADSLAKIALSDSLAVADSISVMETSADSLAAEVVLTPEEIKARKKAEKAKKRAEAKAAREAKAKERIEKREKRWAELDQRDAEKLKAKEEKKKEKERRRKRKALETEAKRLEKEAAVLERYRLQYEKKKVRDAGK